MVLLYCCKCQNKIESANSRVAKTISGRIMLLSKCALCDRKNSEFISYELLSSLGIKPPLSKVLIVGSISF